MFYRFLAWIMPTNTVDGAIRALVNAANLLAAAEARQLERAGVIEEEIDFLTTEREAALAEAARAQRVAAKLADLTA